MNQPESFKYDVRIRERAIKMGMTTQAEVVKHLAGLKDAEGQVHAIELEQPALVPPPRPVLQQVEMIGGVPVSGSLRSGPFGQGARSNPLYGPSSIPGAASIRPTFSNNPPASGPQSGNYPSFQPTFRQPTFRSEGHPASLQPESIQPTFRPQPGLQPQPTFLPEQVPSTPAAAGPSSSGFGPPIQPSFRPEPRSFGVPSDPAAASRAAQTFQERVQERLEGTGREPRLFPAFSAPSPRPESPLAGDPRRIPSPSLQGRIQQPGGAVPQGGGLGARPGASQPGPQYPNPQYAGPAYPGAPQSGQQVPVQHSASPNPAGPNPVGPHSAGPHSAGPHSAGPHSAGPHSAGPHSAGPHSRPQYPPPVHPAPTTHPAQPQSRQPAMQPPAYPSAPINPTFATPPVRHPDVIAPAQTAVPSATYQPTAQPVTEPVTPRVEVAAPAAPPAKAAERSDLAASPAGEKPPVDVGEPAPPKSPAAPSGGSGVE